MSVFRCDEWFNFASVIQPRASYNTHKYITFIHSNRQVTEVEYMLGEFITLRVLAAFQHHRTRKPQDDDYKL